jgi:uncharacterized protein DUF4326
MPERIQLRRTVGWRKPEGAVVVSRPGRWGNPFAYRTRTALARVPALDGSAWEYEDRISADGMRHDYHHPGGRVTEHWVRYMTRAECVELYRRALVTPTPQLYLLDRSRARLTVEDVRTQLAGRDLACWCRPDQPCHADVLLELANRVG